MPMAFTGMSLDRRRRDGFDQRRPRVCGVARSKGRIAVGVDADFALLNARISLSSGRSLQADSCLPRQQTGLLMAGEGKLSPTWRLSKDGPS
jgi:hypothetical protein